MTTEINTYTPEDLEEIQRKHTRWQRGQPNGIRANLSEANLRGADLRWANLRWANLSEADLREANLRWANLSGANLSGADLSGADLRWANLRWADLREANLRGANLSEANLRWANLSGADLSGADLREANLSEADLRGANLRGANLSEADLSAIRADFFAVLDVAPGEVAGLRQTLVEGRMDGTVYEGECACLVGTIAKFRGVEYDAIPGLVPQSWRAAERWFLAITKGKTPENSQPCAITVHWIDEWQALRDASPSPDPIGNQPQE